MPIASILARPQFTAAEHEAEVALADGRRLSYALFGAPAGPLVVVLDGPGSRGLARAAAAAAEQLGVRLVAPDRPGFGGSPQIDGGDRIAAWPGDHAALLAALGADRAGIVAQSGGTPYALAAAEKAAARIAAGLPPRDAEIMRHPANWAIHQRATAEILARPDAVAREIARLARPWGIAYEAIDVPVALWSGDRDEVHPTSHARRIAELLPGEPAVHVVAGAATFGLMPSYGEALRFAARLG